MQTSNIQRNILDFSIKVFIDFLSIIFLSLKCFQIYFNSNLLIIVKCISSELITKQLTTGVCNSRTGGFAFLSYQLLQSLSINHLKKFITSLMSSLCCRHIERENHSTPVWGPPTSPSQWTESFQLLAKFQCRRLWVFSKSVHHFYQMEVVEVRGEASSDVITSSELRAPAGSSLAASLTRNWLFNTLTINKVLLN